jgi:hypothetical protein
MSVVKGSDSGILRHVVCLKSTDISACYLHHDFSFHGRRKQNVPSIDFQKTTRYYIPEDRIICFARLKILT